MNWSDAQTRAIVTRGSNLVVSAGAGSGKTAVLVERVVELLASSDDLHVENILIMTFTEAAAGEMRGRLASRLEERMQAFLESGDTVLARRFEREADGLWSAQISTIHSFCLELIRSHVFSAGVSPDFRLLDGNEEEILLVQQAKETIESALSEADGESIRAMMIELRLADVTQLTRFMRRMYALARSQQSPRRWLHDAADAYAIGDRTLSDAQFFPAFRNYIIDKLEVSLTSFFAAKRLAESIEELQSYVDWLVEAEGIVQEAMRHVSQQDVPIEQLAHILTRIETLKKPRSSYKGVEADEVKDLRKTGKAELDGMLVLLGRGEQELAEDLRVLSGPVHTLCALVERFMNEVEARKRLDNVLDFGDLEHVAYHLLSNDAAVHSRVQDSFAHVFVDEYQDTSPIQDAIVDLVTNDRHNLFAVGDVKQSIYRFRMAEPSLFLSRYGRYAHDDGGQTIDLTENYRSRSQIVSFINFVFAQLFSEKTTDFAYDEHARMDSRADYPDVSLECPLISVHLLDRSSLLEADVIHDESPVETTQSVDGTALESEAQLAARLIEDMLYKDKIQVWDKRDGCMRPARPGDVAILLRSGRSALNTVVEALQSRSIPANANTSTGFFDALEVKWLLAILSVLDNPRDDLALVTVLHSPLFQWSEEDLGAIRTLSGGAYWDALRQGRKTDGTRELAQAFFHSYDSWRQTAKLSGVRELLDTIIDDKAFMSYIQGMPRGEVRRANVTKFLDMALSYDESTADSGIYGFLERFREQDEANVDVGVAAVEVPDAVQVMTIHRSKGLEFPVVLVMDLGKQFRVTQDLVYLHRDLGLGAVRYHRATQQRWRTIASIAAAQAERKSTLAEEARILYVAMTRARERLVLIGSTRNLNQMVTRSAYAHDLKIGRLMSGSFMRAKSYMDWLLPILLRHPGGSNLHQLLPRELWDGHVLSSEAGAHHGLSIHLANLDSISGMEETVLPYHESTDVDWDAWLDGASSASMDSPTVRVVGHKHGGVEWLFGKVSATDMRRLASAMNDSPRAETHTTSAASLLEDPAFTRSGSATPREQGIAFHAFMQRYALPIGASEDDVKREMERLKEQQLLSVEESSALDVEAIVRFLQSNLGVRLQQAKRVYREQPFFHRIDVAVSEANTYPVIAQGVIDCVFEEEYQWTIIDYKTDAVTRHTVQSKATEYTAQVATYLAALEPLTQDKPVHAYLYFVNAHESVEVPRIHLPDIFHNMLKQRETIVHNPRRDALGLSE